MKKYNKFVNEVFDFDKPLKVWQSLLLTLVVIACLCIAIACLYATKVPDWLGEKIMSDLALVIKYMFKETFNPSLHHATFQEFIDDVESDVSKRTNDFKYVKYINFLNALNK